MASRDHPPSAASMRRMTVSGPPQAAVFQMIAPGGSSLGPPR